MYDLSSIHLFVLLNLNYESCCPVTGPPHLFHFFTINVYVHCGWGKTKKAKQNTSIQTQGLNNVLSQCECSYSPETFERLL